MAFLNMTQVMATQDQVVTTKVQAMTAHTNPKVGPCVNQYSRSMVSRFVDFTMINPPTFLGSNVGENPHDFLDEVYKIFFSMG